MSGNYDFIAWLNQFPEVVAILLVACGWVLAHFARRGVAATIIWINRRSKLWGSRTRPALSPSFGRALQQVVYWGIVAVFIILGLSHVGGGPLSDLTESLWGLTSRVLVAVAILAGGHILGSLARGFVSGFSHKADLTALPRLTYGLIVGIALITAINHLGLNVTFVTEIVLLVVGVFFAGLGLAFAIGARTLVANLAAQVELNRYRTGDTLKVEDVEGTVVEIGRTGMILATSGGLAHIPASKFAEVTVLLVRKDVGDE